MANSTASSFIRRKLQRAYFRDWEKLSFPRWPVDFTVDNIHEQLLRVAIETSATKEIPFIWFWPAGADSCLIVTHDVETAAGRDFTSTLIDEARNDAEERAVDIFVRKAEGGEEIFLAGFFAVEIVERIIVRDQRIDFRASWNIGKRPLDRLLVSRLI